MRDTLETALSYDLILKIYFGLVNRDTWCSFLSVCLVWGNGAGRRKRVGRLAPIFLYLKILKIYDIIYLESEERV